jgi:hypothetical protein
MGVPGSANLLLLGGQQGYQISRSLRFNSADSAYLNRTPASAGNRRTATWSGWIKLGNHSSTGEYYLLCTNGTSDSTFFYIQIRDNQLRFGQFNSGTFALYSTQLFRDPSAWYHIVVAVDTTQATASNRAKAYVNGTEITSWSTANYPAQNNDLGISDTRAHAIGAGYASGSPYAYWDGYVTETYLVDGQALTPSSFGETDTITGVWKPKKYSGTYGTNGFYLNFSDNSGTTSTTLGKDSSGNSNNWTPNNFSVTAGAGNDSLIDTPTPYADGGNGRGNYCTLNPLTSGSFNTLANGNLQLTGNTSTNNGNTRGTFAFTTGKWYLEMTASATSAGVYPSLGIIKTANATAPDNGGTNQVGYPSDSVAYENSGNKRINNSTSSYGNSFTTGDTIGVAIDADNGAIYFSKNGTWQNSGVPTSGGSKTGAAYTWTGGSMEYIFATAQYNASSADYNFGQRPFAYTLPSGFVALNTQNLPEPSIKKPSSYFDTLIYTGDGSTTRSITGLSFSPDLLWHKSRSSADDHRLMDSVRAGGTDLSSKTLFSNLTSAEDTSGSGYVTQTSSGFNLGVGASPYNVNTRTYVAWCWDESATPGFDIVTYTGTGVARTVAHSLGVAPKMMIIKTRTTAGKNWAVYHAANGTPQNNVVYLNQTTGTNSSAGQWNSTAPTSSVFSVSGSPSSGYDDVNLNGDNYVAYLWSEVAGFSKFGSYFSNGSSDGPYIHCGFRPKAVWIKKATGTTNANSGWCIFDSTRSTYNTTSANLRADLSDAESTFSALDFTSTGFKLRVVSIEVNVATSGDTYIFCAWAETPAKFSLAR